LQETNHGGGRLSAKCLVQVSLTSRPHIEHPKVHVGVFRFPLNIGFHVILSPAAYTQAAPGKGIELFSPKKTSRFNVPTRTGVNPAPHPSHLLVHLAAASCVRLRIYKSQRSAATVVHPQSSPTGGPRQALVLLGSRWHRTCGRHSRQVRCSPQPIPPPIVHSTTMNLHRVHVPRG
jgi:hypothetical protein